MGGLNMNTYEALNFPLPFCGALRKKFTTITSRDWCQGDTPTTNIWPLKSQHTHFLCFRVSERVCVWAFVCVCVRACIYVCVFIFMKHALPSHTVGVSRSSSFAINHCRQLVSAQSACERAACVCVCVCVCASKWACTRTCMCAFDCGRAAATVLPRSPPWLLI